MGCGQILTMQANWNGKLTFDQKNKWFFQQRDVTPLNESLEKMASDKGVYHKRGRAHPTGSHWQVMNWIKSSYASVYMCHGQRRDDFMWQVGGSGGNQKQTDISCIGNSHLRFVHIPAWARLGLADLTTHSDASNSLPGQPEQPEHPEQLELESFMDWPPPHSLSLSNPANLQLEIWRECRTSHSCAYSQAISAYISRPAAVAVSISAALRVETALNRVACQPELAWSEGSMWGPWRTRIRHCLRS